MTRADDRDGERAFQVRGTRFNASPLEPALYVVATPIGHLGDVTLRALETLAAADLIACEDTRVTRRLLDRYGIRNRLAAYHEHSGEGAHRRLLEALAEGGTVALVSDAGTPLVSDPGARLVADARAAGIRVVPIPGPSAIAAALSAGGLPTDAFLFLGFLPARAAARRKQLEKYATVDATLVLFESPNRVAALLAEAAQILGGGRVATLCRELTKIHETFDRGTLAELSAASAAADVKGEIVLLIAPPPEAPPPDPDEISRHLGEALQTMGVKEAARSISEATGLSRRELYRQALMLKGKR